MKTLRTMFCGLLLSITFVTLSATPSAALQIPGPLTKGNLVMGAKVAGTGASLFGEVSNPVGWAIGAASIAWWAYDATDGFTKIDLPGHSLDWYADRDPNFEPSTEGGGPHYVDVVQDTTISLNGTRNLLIDTKCLTSWLLPNIVTCADFPSSVQTALAGSSQTINPTESTAKQWAACEDSGSHVVTNIRPNFSYLSNYATGTVKHIEVPVCPAGSVLQGIWFSGITTASGGAQHGNMSVGTLAPSGLPDGDVSFGRYDVDVKCKNFETQAVEHLTSYTNASDGGAVLPSCARLGENWRAAGVTITPTKPEIDNEPIPDEIEVPDFLPFDWDELLPDDPKHQDCQESKKGCELDIFIDGKRCYEGSDLCKIWTKVAQKEPGRVDCKWGTQVMPITVCNVLTHFYEPDTTTTTGTETTTPTTGTDTSTDTTTGTTTVVNPDKPLTNTTNDTATAKCLPEGWAKFNPIEWIYRPVLCAVKEAFIPQTSLTTRLTRMKTKLMTRAPFTWAASLAVLPAAVDGGGCPTNWAFHYRGDEYSVLCGTLPGNTLHNARPLITVLALGACVYPFLRSLVYASFPIIKPHPSD